MVAAMMATTVALAAAEMVVAMATSMITLKVKK